MKHIHTLKQELQKEFPHLDEKYLEKLLQELLATQPSVTIDASFKKQLAQKLETLGELSSGKTAGIQRFSKKTPWLLGLSGFAFCLGAFALVFSSFDLFELDKDDRDYSVGGEILDTTVDVSEKRAEKTVIIEAEEIEKTVVTDETTTNSIEEEKNVEAGKGEYTKKSIPQEESNDIAEVTQEVIGDIETPQKIEVVPLLEPAERIVDTRTEMIQTRSVKGEKSDEVESDSVEKIEDTSLEEVLEKTVEIKSGRSVQDQSDGSQMKRNEKVSGENYATDDYKTQATPRHQGENYDMEPTNLKSIQPITKHIQKTFEQKLVEVYALSSLPEQFRRFCNLYEGLYNQEAQTCVKKDIVCEYIEFSQKDRKSCPFMK